MKTVNLTKNQIKIFSTIDGLIMKRGVFPTYAQIAAKAKKNPNSISHYVALYKKLNKIK